MEEEVSHVVRRVLDKLGRIARAAPLGGGGRVPFSFNRELPGELQLLKASLDTSALGLYNIGERRIVAEGLHEARGGVRFDAEEAEEGYWIGVLSALYAKADVTLPFRRLELLADTSSVKLDTKTPLEEASLRLDTCGLTGRLTLTGGPLSVSADTSSLSLTLQLLDQGESVVNLEVDTSRVVMVIVSPHPPNVVDRVEKRSSHLKVDIPEPKSTVPRVTLRGRAVSSSIILSWKGY